MYIIIIIVEVDIGLEIPGIIHVHAGYRLSIALYNHELSFHCMLYLIEILFADAESYLELFN